MGFLKQGKEIHGLAIRSDCHEHEHINNALITLYSRCGNVAYTRSFLHLTSSRTIVTWNTMISAIAATTSIPRVTIFLQEMIGSKTPPNHITIVTMTSLFAEAADPWHGNLLIAQRLFDMMENRDRISYTTLIGGYGLQGSRMFARKLFLEMISQGIEPDEIAIDVVRSAWRRIRLHGGWNHSRVAANC
ncbi:hypothetical protein HPP92_026255 [Vanilla planifolia]|uniref:Pentatricopeptide repeat-containing protein n=1 Tax=Vanilla planifolia TaxID=51239 RepID=A0A835PKH3_VANPL|nr:hypothetical protein HPP92_026255 [Vanilla planifolia]